MLEEQVGESVEVFHLHVCSRQHVRLLVALDEANRDVALLDREFVSLLGDHTHDIAELALDGELSDSPHHELSLMRGDRATDA